MPLTGTPDRNALLDRLRHQSRVCDDLFRRVLTAPVPLLGQLEREVRALEEGFIPEGVER